MTGWTVLLAAHATSALVCLGLGAHVLLRRRKGDVAHRTAGWCWMAGMAFVATSSFAIRDLRDGRFSFLHVLSVVTLVSLALGIRAARRSDVPGHRANMRGSYFGLVGAFIGAVAVPDRHIPTFVITQPLGALGATAAIAATTAGLVVLGTPRATGKRTSPPAPPTTSTRMLLCLVLRLRRHAMAPTDATIRPLLRSDVAAATAVLSASHADYPAFRHLWLDPAVRARALLPFLRTSVADAAALQGSAVAGDEEGMLAVALWLPPGAFPWSPARKARAAPAFLRTALAAPRAFPAFAQLGAAAERTHPSDPHWYLQTLGVDPRAQRQGLGQRVLRPGLERVNATGLACYVETSDPANEKFYRRLGFMLVAPRLEHLCGGPPYIGMRR